MLLDITIPAISEKVQLFTLTSKDVSSDYVAWLNDPMVNQYLESRFVSHTIKSTQDFVSSMMKSETDLLLGIRSIELNKHVGNIKLGPIIQRHDTAEVGLMIGDKSVWGKGLATEAIKIVTELARQLELRKLTAGCYESNIGSKRAFIKCGFSEEGVRNAQFLLEGKPEDQILLGLVL